MLRVEPHTVHIAPVYAAVVAEIARTGTIGDHGPMAGPKGCE